MKIKIDEIGRKAIIEIDPKDFYLVKVDSIDDSEWPFGLAYRIDMSYAGKADQWTSPVIFLSEKEAEKLRSIIDEVI